MKAAGYQAGETGPALVVPGGADLPEGFSAALIGMSPGERKQIVLPPEQAFGRHDPALVKKLDKVRRFPRVIRMPADEYVKRFKTFPVVGKEVELLPWFPALVTAVDTNEATLEFKVKDHARFEESFGTVEAHIAGDSITVTLSPAIGASFELEGKEGRISGQDAESFTVDLNHPLAGRDLKLDLEVVSLKKKSTLPTGEIAWATDHDAGLAAARKAGKPAVLVLYADWCGWCKKLFTETLKDPRVREVQERFSWVKVNSDKNREFKARYGQDGFPMLVLFNPDGTINKKLNGFVNGSDLGRVLDDFLHAAPVSSVNWLSRNDQCA